jgi:hypothetical protein
MNNTYLFFNLYNLFIKRKKLNFIFKILNERN